MRPLVHPYVLPYVGPLQGDKSQPGRSQSQPARPQSNDLAAIPPPGWLAGWLASFKAWLAVSEAWLADSKACWLALVLWWGTGECTDKWMETLG